MHDLITCKNKDDSIKNEWARVSIGIWQKFELIQDFMIVKIVICKNEEDPIKKEGTRVFTLYINFSDTQGQITPECMMVCGRNLNSSMRIFSRCSRAANSTVLGLIWHNFELIQDVMDVFVTCKNEEDPIKKEGASSVHNIIHQFFRHSRADISGVHDGMWPKFELILAFMHALVTCKNVDDSIKNEGARVVTTRAANSTVLVPIWPNFKLVQDVMDVLVICKNKENLIKNESTRVVTRFSPL